MDANYLQTILRGQYEAALSMLNYCIRACPAERWEGMIANSTFQQVVYHTLFWTDYYLSSSDEAFALRDVHGKGGDERLPQVSPGVGKEDSLAYAELLRGRVSESLAAESETTLQAPAAFPRKPFSRGELHLYNIRHIQHHTGQLSAYLRREKPKLDTPKDLPWVRSGWV